MILEVRKLLSKAEYSGDFSYEFQPSQDSLLVPLCHFGGNVKVVGSYEIFDDDSVEINLTVRYKLVGQCSYCLDDAEEDIEFSTNVLFVKEDDPDNYRYDGARLDLTPAVNDALLFSQPKVLLCKEGCEGVKIN